MTNVHIQSTMDLKSIMSFNFKSSYLKILCGTWPFIHCMRKQTDEVITTVFHIQTLYMNYLTSLITFISAPSIC